MPNAWDDLKNIPAAELRREIPIATPNPTPAALPPPERPVSRRRSRDDDDEGWVGHYGSPWMAAFASAGPRAMDYASRANLGLDVAGGPLVGPGVGGYASPRETDNAAATFLDALGQDRRQEALNAQRMMALITRLGRYR